MISLASYPDTILSSKEKNRFINDVKFTFSIGDSEEKHIDKTQTKLQIFSFKITFHRFTYTIFPVIRKFSTETDLEAFKKRSKEELLNRIKGLIEFANLDNDIVIDSADFFVIKEDYEALDDARKMEYKKYKDRMANNTKVMFETFYMKIINIIL